MKPTQKKTRSIKERVAALEVALSWYAQELDDVSRKCKCQWHTMQCDGPIKRFMKRLLGMNK